MLVLLWGLEADTPLAEVHQQLQHLGAPVSFVDQRRILETDVEITAGGRLDGVLRIGKESIDLAEVTAVYLRPYEAVRLPEIAAAGPESHDWKHALAVDDILTTWSEMTPALVVNRCSAMAINGSKPHELAKIRSLGWSVPETLITTDAEAAREFWREHGEVIYKSVSGIRSRVSRLRPEHVDRLAHLASCPTQFQRYIPGTDHRVHVVGDEVFACEVSSDDDDYRYPRGKFPEIRPCALTRALRDKCRELAAAMEFSLAGIDLRRTPEGEWFCFEVNPSPAFTYYQEAAGLPIGEALARLLAEGQSAAAANHSPALLGRA